MTKISGLVALCLGLLILISAYVFESDAFFAAAIYSIPMMIIGFVIILRKSEDAIEQINYRRLKK